MTTPEHPFKPGDRVVRVGKKRGDYGPGILGTVKSVAPAYPGVSSYIRICWDRDGGTEETGYSKISCEEHIRHLVPKPEDIEAAKQEAFATLARLAKALGFKLVAEDDDDDTTIDDFGR